ncbi:MAG: deoxyribodipyrimidine photo-lyase [Saprospiraceae bacterium]|nr:deoxyribodipyrimidine photo-lyase [Saprospiraceae bacterium]
MSLNIFWFRRDLRLNDNAALYRALKSGKSVLPIFIFDKNILNKLEDRTDARVTFLYDTLTELKQELEKIGSTLLVFYDEPTEVWRKLTTDFDIKTVFANHDFEPYALKREASVAAFLTSQHIDFHTFKDHVIFEKNEVTKDDGLPYTVFTPYSKKWKTKLMSKLSTHNDTTVSYYFKPYPTEKYFPNFAQKTSITSAPFDMPSLEYMNFQRSTIPIPSKTVARGIIKTYDTTRDFPALKQGTSKLGIHFRFGTISIREKALSASHLNETFLNELIWRDFYAQILHHFPHIGAGKAFRAEYDRIEWRDNEADFEHWCAGTTGYPMVDAGMRELNKTGHMHNRVRMIVSSFLTKHLLIDWRWGEAYFAQKLLDFDLASNNGGWQWAAGSGTDAAPYFRIFNPEAQREKFDKDYKYIKQWIPEFGTPAYPKPIVDHKLARERCLETYGKALKKDV